MQLELRDSLQRASTILTMTQNLPLAKALPAVEMLFPVLHDVECHRMDLLLVRSVGIFVPSSRVEKSFSLRSQQKQHLQVFYL